MGDHLTINHKLKQEQCTQDPPTSEALKAKNLLENADDVAMIPKKVGKPRSLLVISAQPTATMRAEIVAGKHPLLDYDALEQALGADVIYPNNAQAMHLGCLIKRLLGPFAALAWTAFHHRHEYDILFTDAEIVGLPLAMLLKLSRARPGCPRHVTLAHYLTPLKKRIFFHLGVASHIDTVIVHSAAQYALATKVLHMPSERVMKLPYFVDTSFWQPFVRSTVESDAAMIDEQPPMICAAGLEFRDYRTLLTAVGGLNVNVHIAAASADAFHRAAINPRFKTSARLSDVPSNVFVKSYNYAGMRQLYTTARFVVVPVRETDFQAGISVILEAMAMGKAVIVSGTRGQTDVVRDPRNHGRGPVLREWWPGFLDTPGLAETLGSLPTGFYVTPGNSNELRDTIQYLLDHPEIADELGHNGRRVAESYFGLDAFARRFAAAIRGEPERDGAVP